MFINEEVSHSRETQLRAKLHQKNFSPEPSSAVQCQKKQLITIFFTLMQKKYLMSTYYGLGTVLDIEIQKKARQTRFPSFGAYVPVGETDNKEIYANNFSSGIKNKTA